MNKIQLNNIIDLFEKNYGDLKPFLNYNNAFQLLIAVILSAQCTDKRVNIITEELFQLYKQPSNLAEVPLEIFENQIKTCGMYHTKAKNIIETSKVLKNKFSDDVPADFDALVNLPGIGRKSANVILGTYYGQNRFPVDTHVFRVSNRIGLANSTNVENTETDLTNLIKPELWMKMHRWLINHGRTYCIARNPKCSSCFLTQYCNYYKNNKN
jgi:endonuclease-3